MNINVRNLFFTATIALPLSVTAGVPQPPLVLTDAVDIRAVLGETVLTDFAVQNNVGSETTFDIDYSVSQTNAYEVSPGVATGSLVHLSQPDGLGE